MRWWLVVALVVGCKRPEVEDSDVTDTDVTDTDVADTDVTDTDDTDPCTDVWYADDDGDGFGDPTASTIACEAPDGTVADASDCDDTSDAVNPAASEICNLLDDDCDGETDVDAIDAPVRYPDADGDGFGDEDAAGTASCEDPGDTSLDASDCDDANGGVYPGATEVCNLADDDCDGVADEDVTPTWYLDDDGDGFGTTASAAEACEAPADHVLDDGDCDDADDAVHPGAPEGCDGVDHDCDGAIDNDDDGDGASDAACGGDDCNDADPGAVPEASGACALGVDCADVMAAGFTTSGTYAIDPDGYGTGVEPFDVSCDMTTDGGGWTLALHVFATTGLEEDAFRTTFGDGLFTEHTWSWTSAGGFAAALPDGLVQRSTQGAVGTTLLDGLWDDVRMTCSTSDDDATEVAWVQVDGYATTNGSTSLLGAAANGTAYTVDSTTNSASAATVWHDNETATQNSNHYLCDIYDGIYDSSAGGTSQFGFCYTDHLNDPNTSDMGDSIVSIAFGTVEGNDFWSPGFTVECGVMADALHNQGTVSIWLR